MNICLGTKFNGEPCGNKSFGSYCFRCIINGNKQCCVCLETKVCDTLECGHDLCEECAYTWNLSKKLQADCPMCRAPLTKAFQNKYRYLAYKRGDAALIRAWVFLGDLEMYTQLKDIDFKYDTPLNFGETNKIFDEIENIDPDLVREFYLEIQVIVTTTESIREKWNIPWKEYTFIEPDF
jgi:hypothetical protein